MYNVLQEINDCKTKTKDKSHKLSCPTTKSRLGGDKSKDYEVSSNKKKHEMRTEKNSDLKFFKKVDYEQKVI